MFHKNDIYVSILKYSVWYFERLLTTIGYPCHIRVDSIPTQHTFKASFSVYFVRDLSVFKLGLSCGHILVRL